MAAMIAMTLLLDYGKEPIEAASKAIFWPLFLLKVMIILFYRIIKAVVFDFAEIVVFTYKELFK